MAEAARTFGTIDPARLPKHFDAAAAQRRGQRRRRQQPCGEAAPQLGVALVSIHCMYWPQPTCRSSGVRSTTGSSALHRRAKPSGQNMGTKPM
jgi:hypothetical protein